MKSSEVRIAGDRSIYYKKKLCECHFILSDPRIVRAVQNPPNDFTTCNNKNFGATT